MYKVSNYKKVFIQDFGGFLTGDSKEVSIALQTEWREVEGFPDYIVSENGHVKNVRRNVEMSLRLNKEGFVMVNFSRDKKLHTRSVGRVVAKAFLEPPRNRHYNSIIHLNGDRADCRAINVMWRPRPYTLRYHQMFEEMPARVGVYIPELDKYYYSLREFCTTYGLVESSTYLDMANERPCFHYGWMLERYYPENH